MEGNEAIQAPRRLTRPREGRWLGGVATGLGEYFDLNPTIYRIAFVAPALAGGTGVLLYAAAWLVVPEDGAEESVAAAELRKHRDHPLRLLVVGGLAFAAILSLSEAHVWPTSGCSPSATAAPRSPRTWSSRPVPDGCSCSTCVPDSER